MSTWVIELVDRAARGSEGSARAGEKGNKGHRGFNVDAAEPLYAVMQSQGHASQVVLLPRSVLGHMCLANTQQVTATKKSCPLTSVWLKSMPDR